MLVLIHLFYVAGSFEETDDSMSEGGGERMMATFFNLGVRPKVRINTQYGYTRYANTCYISTWVDKPDLNLTSYDTNTSSL
jgi:hypothetical protein